MAYTNFQHCTANEYKNIIYNQETNNKIKILFNNVELEDADEYCESFEVVSRVIPNGSKIFMLENLVSQEATLVLHNIDTSIIQDQVSISIGTLVSENTYEYVPIGIYNLQEIPTTDNGKTTIKLRDNSVKLDFNYNAKPLIDEHGGTATKLQILQDICSQANITCNVASFIGSSDLIGIYDNTITGRQYVAYLAGSAGAIPIITRTGALDFKYLNNLSIIQIPIEIVEQYSNAENFKISRVVYEDAIRKYESGNETYDTLFLDSANPYISSQEQVASIYNIVNNFEINSFTTGRILGNPAIDSYDLIQITDYDGTIFKTFANNTLRYNGKMINTFASEISFERKKENVSLKSGATFKKYAKTEIDNLNAEITIQAGQIDTLQGDLATPTTRKRGEYIDIDDAGSFPLVDFVMEGDTKQDTTTGKNYFNNAIVRTNEGGFTNVITDTTIDTGKRLTYTGTTATGNRYLIYSIMDLTNYVGKTIRFKSSFSPSASNVGRYYIGLCNADGSNRTSKATSTSSNDLLSFVVPELTGEQTYLVVGLYVNASGSNTVNAGDYVDYTNMILTINNDDMTYEEYSFGQSPNPDFPQPIQTVTGRNEIKITGKNLFDYTTSAFSTPSLVNITTEDNTITITTASATTSNNLFFFTKIPDELLENGQSYTISSENVSGVAQSLKLQLRNKNGTNAGKSRLDTVEYDSNYSLYVDGNIFSTSSSETIPSGTTAIIKNVQVEKSSTATEYEEYKEKTQEINLGKNLFAFGTTAIDKTSTYRTNTTQRLILSETNDVNKVKFNYSGKYCRGYFEIEGIDGTQDYAISFNVKENTTSYTPTYAIDTDNSNSNKLVFYIGGGNGNTSVSNTDYFILENIQLEKSNVATTYASYFEPIYLRKKETHIDYIHKNNNKWYWHKALDRIILNGTQTISKSSSGSSYNVNRYYFSATGKLDTSRTLMISDYFKILTSYNANVSGMFGGGASETNRVYFQFDSSFTDKDTVEKVTTWLSTHNVIVDYVLAEPQEVEITNTDLINQLENLMSTSLFRGINHITVDTFNLQPTIEIEYKRDTDVNYNFSNRSDLDNYYTKIETNAQIQVASGNIMTEVEEVRTAVDENSGSISSLSNQVNTLQTSTDYLIDVTNEINENGVTKVKTTTNYTFNADGLNIQKSGSSINSKIDNNGFEIKDGSNTILFAGYNTTTQKTEVTSKEMIAEKITAGKHRCEVYPLNNEDKTAWFYVG